MAAVVVVTDANDADDVIGYALVEAASSPS
jgi:hypothetical protein